MTRKPFDCQAEAVFRLVSYNVLSLKQWGRMEEIWKTLRPYDAIQLFKEFDEDGSGDLGIDEFAKLLPKMGIQLNKNVLQDVVDMFDKDGDGSVSMTEFLTVLFPTSTRFDSHNDDDELFEERKTTLVSPMTTRKLIWRCMEDKNYSLMSKVYANTMMGCIVVSTMLSWLETVVKNAPDALNKNRTTLLSVLLQFAFLLELLVRFIACPDRKRFFFNAFNLLDLVIAVGMIPVLLVIYTGMELSPTQQSGVYGLRTFFPTLLMLKILRRFKTINLLLLACKQSSQALPVLLYTLFVICLAFTAIFFIVETPGAFADVKECFWFVIVTVTTIGYGDMYPKTSTGKVAAGCLITVGVLFVAIPIGIVGNAFSSVWEAKDRLLSVNRLRENVSWLGLSSYGIRQIFDDFDESGNGSLDINEFRKFLRVMGVKLPRKAVKDAFESCDTNGDGTLRPA
jgi:Ca2+-binding EF-hand superfamily protein